MKITSSSIQLAAETSRQERNEKRDSLTVWKGNQQRRTLHSRGERRLHHQAQREMAAHQSAVNVSLSKGRPRPVERTADMSTMHTSPVDDLKLDILKAMVEKLTGKKIDIMKPEEILGNNGGEESQQKGDRQAPVSQDGDGFGMIYDFYESHYEYESMDFSATGSITTSDGMEIDFSVSLSMSREFYMENHVQLRAGEALKDPLSVNFSGTAAQLTDTTFSFDIDADGRSEQIAFLQPGTGFLALDRNGDGKINDGSELFGATTGDGFSELSRFDRDGNSFIDENDPIYDRLRIWEKDQQGRDRLIALGRAGIGAIFLGSASSSYDIKDHENTLLGRVEATGIFLREDGSAGIIQQLDLVV